MLNIKENIINKIDKIKNKDNIKERIWYIDLLKIISMFAVIIIHVNALQWGSVTNFSAEWHISNLVYILTKWSVPVFVMCSGMMFLDKNKKIPLNTLYKKYIFRIAKLLLIWIVVYYLFKGIVLGNPISLESFFDMFKKGSFNYHLWFMWMIMGLYMITPILKKIIDNSSKKEIEYFLIFAFIFGSLFPALSTFEKTKWFTNMIKEIQITMFGGFVGYYVLGYYIKNFDIKKNIRKFIYCLSLISIIGTLFITYKHTGVLALNKRYEMAFSYTWPNIAIISTAIVLFFKYYFSKKDFSNNGKKIINILSKHSLNIYLAHDIFIIIFQKYNIYPNSFNINSLITILVLSCWVFIGSFILSICISYLIDLYINIKMYINGETNENNIIKKRLDKLIEGSKMKEKIRKIIDNKSLIIIFLVVIAFFGTLIHVEHATDTYCTFAAGGREIIHTFINSGRVISAGFFGVLRLLNFSNNMMYRISFVISIISMVASIYLLNNIIKKLAKNKTNESLSLIISIITLLNIFVFELFLYVEKGIMVASVLFTVLAFDFTIKFFEAKKYDFKKLIIALLMMILATSAYQGTAALFVALSTVYIATNIKTIKDFLYKNIVVALLYGIPGILNYLIVKIFGVSSRITGNINILESVSTIYEKTDFILKNTFEIMPKYLFLLICLGIVIYICIKITKSKLKLENKIIKILGIAYIIAGTIISAVFPQLLQNTDSIWLVPRSIYPMASLIGVLLMYAVFNVEVKKNEKIGIYLIIILVLFLQFTQFQKIFKDRYIVNYLDKVEANNIKQIIDEYEKESNIEIKNIAFYNDTETKYVYENIRAVGDSNVRGFAVDWSAINALKILGEKTLRKVEPIDELKQKFKNEDWNEFDKNQIIIIDDTIHICLY